MNAFRLELKLHSPSATPWHADTLFGALCWQWRNLFGEPDLLHLLDRFLQAPPFALSDAFPTGYLPAPIGISHRPANSVKKKPPLYLNEDAFLQLLRGQPAPQTVLTEHRELWHDANRLHACIGRWTGATADGGALFETPAERLASSAGLTVFFVAEPDCLDRLSACFQALSLFGFGKKRSAGLGAFEISHEPQPCTWLLDSAGMSGFVALSHFVPSRNDPVRGQWGLRRKHPKYQGDLVSCPFKNTILTLTPGSTFYTGAEPRPICGRMIPLPCPEMPRALHYGLALCAPAAVGQGGSLG